jgi:hypothetical protein
MGWLGLAPLLPSFKHYLKGKEIVTNTQAREHLAQTQRKNKEE